MPRVEDHHDEREDQPEMGRATIEYEKLLDRLTTLAQACGAAYKLKNIFRALCDFALASTSCHAIFISLYDDERHERRTMYAWREGEEVDLARWPPLELSESPHRRALASGQIIVTDDDPAAIDQQPRPLRSSLAAPMIFMGRTLGAIEVQSCERAAFTKEHTTAMRMAAHLAAGAIENVRMSEREMARSEQEAENEKLRNLGHLAAGVAHDFNNALAVVLGRTQLLLRTIVGDEQARGSLEIIETAALDAAEIVRRIQTFARRPPAGHLKSVSLARLISDALQLTRTRWEDDARAAAVNYEMHFARDFEGLDEITANSSELREVFVNLIFNALEAMPAGGQLKVREMKIDGEVVVELTDTGHGIPVGIREHIFEPFFTTKGANGSGLGLAVSYGIMQRHQGSIEVESEEGRGTTFRLRFPQASVESSLPSTSSSAEKPIALPARRVLVVDDEKVVREVLVEMLTALNQQPVAVDSAAEALEELIRHSFDLMITDLSMPFMDGLTLAAKARRRAPRMLIALATGYGQTMLGRMPETSLIDTMISKPFQLSDLETMLLALFHDGEKRP